MLRDNCVPVGTENECAAPGRNGDGANGSAGEHVRSEYAFIAHRRQVLANELRAAALDYGALGIPVFPFRPDGLRAYVKWSRDAEPGPSTDPGVICAWWRRWPLAMIAIPTGERSGLLVLDLDRKNGVDGIAELRRLGLVIDPDTPEVTTPSGGVHYYFSWSAADGLRNSAGKIAPGIDVRGEGGMVIAPPSRRTLDGLDYGWAEGSKPLAIGGPR